MDEYYSVTQAAEELKMNYFAFMQRIYRGDVDVLKVGSNILVLKTEVKKLKKSWGKTNC